MLNNGNLRDIRKDCLAVNAVEPYSGAIASFNSPIDRIPLKDVKVDLNPVQDLHGYSNPWPAGGGVNKLIPCAQDTKTSSAGLTVVSDGKGKYTLTGPTTAVTGVNFDLPAAVTFPTGTIYLHLLNDAQNTNVSIAFLNEGTQLGYNSLTGSTNRIVEASYLSGATVDMIRFSVNGALDIGTINLSPMVIVGDNSSQAYSPYANICPIAGWTGANVARTGKNLIPSDVRTIKDTQLTSITAIDSTINGISAKKITVAGETTSWGWRIRYANIWKYLKPSTSYRITLFTDYNYPISLITDNGSGAYRLANSASCSPVEVSTGVYKYSGVITTKPADDECWTKHNQVLTPYCSSINAVAGTYIYSDVLITLADDTNTDFEPYSGSTVSVTFPALGSNQWDEDWELGAINDSTGQNADSTMCIRSKNYVPVEAETSYYYVNGGGGLAVVYYYDSDKAYLNNHIGATAGSSFTTPTNAAYLRFFIEGTYGTTYNNDIAINYPSTKTTYEPYSNTVYSGELDVTTGELAVTHGIADLSTFSWNSMSYNRFGSNSVLTGVKIPESNDENVVQCAEKYIADSINQFVTNQRVCVGVNITGYIVARTGTEDTPSGSMVYELATPLTYHLTPNQISALLGANNVWADTGDVSMEYGQFLTAIKRNFDNERRAYDS